MWIFLILLAVIPLFFFWTDAAVELVPHWASILPQNKDSTSTLKPGQTAPSALDIARRAGKPIPWTETKTEKGYAAFLLSPDDKYRLVAGCQIGQPPSLHFTQISGAAVTVPLIVDFAYGQVQLTQGYYPGADLVGSVGQMEKISIRLTDGNTTKPGTLVTTFNTMPLLSESVARSLSQNCER